MTSPFRERRARTRSSKAATKTGRHRLDPPGGTGGEDGGRHPRDARRHVLTSAFGKGPNGAMRGLAACFVLGAWLGISCGGSSDVNFDNAGTTGAGASSTGGAG